MPPSRPPKRRFALPSIWRLGLFSRPRTNSGYYQCEFFFLTAWQAKQFFTGIISIYLPVPTHIFSYVCRLRAFPLQTACSYPYALVLLDWLSIFIDWEVIPMFFGTVFVCEFTVIIFPHSVICVLFRLGFWCLLMSPPPPFKLNAQCRLPFSTQKSKEAKKSLKTWWKLRGNLFLVSFKF